MPSDPDLPELDYRRLFRDPDMFDSVGAFEDAGFSVIRRKRDTTIMVGRYKGIDDFLFKKYNAHAKSLEDQLENYSTRVAGAQALRAFIEQHQLRHITVPRKWRYELPPEFGKAHRKYVESSYVLIVERLDVLSETKNEKAYRDIDKDVLKDLCTVLFRFRGLDSTAKNMPFTKDGQIAFIDTEGWDGSREERLRYVGKLLPPKREDKAHEYFSDLERDERRRRKRR